MVNLLSGDRREPHAPAPLSEVDRVRLQERLIGTRRFAALRPANGPIASRHRSAELKPELEEELTPASLEARLHELARRRDRDLASRDDMESEPESGRLLVCELDMSIGDGRSEAASEGFFDVDDRPPWDLWLIGFGRSRPTQPDEPLVCLLAWVPAALVGYAQAGIDANRCRSVYWPAEEHEALADPLRTIV